MEKNEKSSVKSTVSPKNYTGGPHGLGDPDDLSLRRVEKDILIPKKVREKSRIEKCPQEVKAKCIKLCAEFSQCAKENGLLVVTRCREENEILKDCLKKWFFDKDFIEECKKEYLKERSEYRRTGLTMKERQNVA